MFGSIFVIFFVWIVQDPHNDSFKCDDKIKPWVFFQKRLKTEENKQNKRTLPAVYEKNAQKNAFIFLVLKKFK